MYHSGFPKATDIGKSIDKRQGAEREVVGYGLSQPSKSGHFVGEQFSTNETGERYVPPITAASTDLAKKYDGAKAGFQPKPSREVIIVGMKPFVEGSYIDHVLNFEALPDNIKMTYPLIQTPKPAKKEKDFGLSGEEKSTRVWRDDKGMKLTGSGNPRKEMGKNNHPTVKPIKLMSYLITLFTRPGDWILDPFGGSGTTGLACKLLDRNHIYIDFTEEYYDIAEERFKVSKDDLKKLLKEKIKDGQQELF